TNRHREILPGRRYEAPPAPSGGNDPFEVDQPGRFLATLGSISEPKTELGRALLSYFTGFSPFLAREICARAQSAKNLPTGLEAAWNELFRAIESATYRPVVISTPAGTIEGAYPVRSAQFAPTAQRFTRDLQIALDIAYGSLLSGSTLEEERRKLLGRLDRELDRLKRRLAAAQEALSRAQSAGALREIGDLIMANLTEIPDGASRVTVTDWNTAEPVLITLDPTLSAYGNAEKVYARARKAVASGQAAETRLPCLQRELDEMDALKSAVLNAKDVERLQAIEHELAETRPDTQTPARRYGSAQQDWQGHRISTVLTPQGFRILIGENAESNDYLTTKVARPDDLWLHVRAGKSAHVVIPTGGNPGKVPPAVLETAARLCALHSPQKHSGLVSVDYTLRRFVRKPRGAPPGAVLVTREKTLTVSPGTAQGIS
ncbi:MAG TPA: NFACT family protein, partial [Chthonomonadales bacterium]|nr:NFACT family protein [Chthonomonadales bacterium]